MRLVGSAAVCGGPSPAQVSTASGPGSSSAAAPGLGVSFAAPGRECECTWKLCVEPRTRWSVWVQTAVPSSTGTLLYAALDRVPDAGEGTFRFAF